MSASVGTKTANEITQRAKSIELAATAECPCNSGLQYSSCCKRKNFKWMENEAGEFFQVIPISPKAGRVIESSRRKFKRIFGRDPLAGDPMFVEQYLVSARDLHRETEDTIIAAGISPEILYAYRKTGRLVTRQNARLMPDTDVSEWHAAIYEYRAIKKKRLREPSAIVELRSFAGELDACIVLLGYFLERGVRRRRVKSKSKSAFLSVDEYTLFCAARCLSALQSIDWMLDKERGVDTMALVRAVYECYLHMRFLEVHPEKLRDIVDAQIGLQRGTHSFAQSAKGVPDRRTIIDKATGERFEGHVSTYRMAQSSRVPTDGFLFPYLYEYLSAFLHPSLESWSDHVVQPAGASPANDGRCFEACCHAITVASMVLDYIRTSGLATAGIKEDLTRVLTRIRGRALKFLRNELSTRPNDFDKQLVQRWSDIATIEA